MSLRRTHPNFWVIYTFTWTAHLWVGLTHLLAKPESFTSPATLFVFDRVDRHVWGVAHILVALVLVLGLRDRRFGLSRLGLAGGLLLTLLRFILLSWAAMDGVGGWVGLPVYYLVFGLHLSQTMEPPRNPVTER